jgi:hypothetical protein
VRVGGKLDRRLRASPLFPHNDVEVIKPDPQLLQTIEAHLGIVLHSRAFSVFSIYHLRWQTFPSCDLDLFMPVSHPSAS